MENKSNFMIWFYGRVYIIKYFLCSEIYYCVILKMIFKIIVIGYCLRMIDYDLVFF